MFQQFQNLQKNQSNPQEFLNEITSKYSPQQLDQFKKYASGFGFTEDQLKQFGIKTK